jgi:hypothetical protein
MANFETFQNYQHNLEENIELKKAVAKLEDLLSKKHLEIENLLKLHTNFKALHEKTRKECADLNQKLIQSYTEKSTLEKKYDSEATRNRQVKMIIK